MAGCIVGYILGNSVEEWTSADIGDCAEKTLYKIHRGPKLTLWRHGVDNLIVDNITVVTEGDGSVYKYECGVFKVIGECADPVRCQESRHCVGEDGQVDEEAEEDDEEKGDILL